MDYFNPELESALNWAFFFDIKKPSKEGEVHFNEYPDGFYSPRNKLMEKHLNQTKKHPAVTAPVQLGLLF